MLISPTITAASVSPHDCAGEPDNDWTDGDTDDRDTVEIVRDEQGCTNVSYDCYTEPCHEPFCAFTVDLVVSVCFLYKGLGNLLPPWHEPDDRSDSSERELESDIP